MYAGLPSNGLFIKPSALLINYGDATWDFLFSLITTAPPTNQLQPPGPPVLLHRVYLTKNDGSSFSAARLKMSATTTQTLVLRSLVLSSSPFLDPEVQAKLKSGNPLLPLPGAPGPRSESIAHAPKRNHSLTVKEQKVNKMSY